MIEVADLQTALRTPGAVMIEARNPPRVYFAGDALPGHCIPTSPIPALPLAKPKLLIPQATTFYLSPTGSDSASGRVANDAWKTLQGAWNNWLTTYDFNDQLVTLQLAHATYRDPLNATGRIAGLSQPGQLIIRGDPANPDNVVVSPPASNSISAAYGAQFSLDGIALDSAAVPPTEHNPNGGADLLVVGQQSSVRIKRLVFHSGGGNGHIVVHFGGDLTVDQPGYTIKAGGQYHISIGGGGKAYYNTDGIPGLITVLVQNTPAFTAGFACAVGSGSSLNCEAVTFNGPATGPTFLVKRNADISTRSNENPNYFPGNVAGTKETGGQYS